MSKELRIYEDSKNYTCQVIKLPPLQKVEGLDNLMKVTVQGNDCLIGKYSNPNELYLFFPAECQIDHEFLKANNLYRHSELNADKTQKGFFEDNRRCKAIKFKGIISTGFVIPVDSLDYLHIQGKLIVPDLKAGDEFSSINGINICAKHYKKIPSVPGAKKERSIETLLDGRMAPQHMDTEHLMKNVHRLRLDDTIAVTYKLHGTSARYFNTLVKRKLSILERIAKFFGAKVQTEEYSYVSASRQVIKSLGFETIAGKNHYYTEDLWSKVGKEYFEGKLNQGEAIYCEIIGRTYDEKEIQSGYSYGFDKPRVYIYRISNINPQGIEVDLTYNQVKSRASQLGVDICPELFYGKVWKFLGRSKPEYTTEELSKFIENKFYNELLEKPSILDASVVEEGFCVRIDKYPKPEIFKIKAKSFLLHEGKMADKEVVNIEDTQVGV